MVSKPRFFRLIHYLVCSIVFFDFFYRTACAEDIPFVQVSQHDHRYLELSNGDPYIPIGLNMLQGPSVENPDQQLVRMNEWIRKLSEQGGNYIRVWLSSSYWDIEHQTSGVYDEEKAKRIDALIDVAREYNVRIKMTIEHFRYFDSNRNRWAAKPIHHVSNGGLAESISDFFDGEKSRAQFKKKLAWFKERYGDEPMIFGWELWNEVDCIQDGDYMAWTKIMLDELQRLFPKNLCLQSLGSFDHENKRERYRQMSLMEGNDIAQVHRYLDLGARLDICKGSVDVLTADAIRELNSYHPQKPLILAESGAVEPGHSGPFKLYAKDTQGIILHDVLFAPFFVGSAGIGQIWHWDYYVAANDLWWQFGRFAEAVKEINPIKEHFEPAMVDHPRMRIYMLKGKESNLVWLRDKENTWKTELEEGRVPETLQGIVLDRNTLATSDVISIKAYDPWKNIWTNITAQDSTITLPDFKRSLVLQILMKV